MTKKCEKCNIEENLYSFDGIIWICPKHMVEALEEIEEDIPLESSLLQNYPHIYTWNEVNEFYYTNFKYDSNGGMTKNYFNGLTTKIMNLLENEEYIKRTKLSPIEQETLEESIFEMLENWNCREG